MDNILLTVIVVAIIPPILILVVIVIYEPLKPHIHNYIIPLIKRTEERIRESRQKGKYGKAYELSENIYKAFSERIKQDSKRHRDHIKDLHEE